MPPLSPQQTFRTIFKTQTLFGLNFKKLAAKFFARHQRVAAETFPNSRRVMLPLNGKFYARRNAKITRSAFHFLIKFLEVFLLYLLWLIIALHTHTYIYTCIYANEYIAPLVDQLDVGEFNGFLLVSISVCATTTHTNTKFIKFYYTPLGGHQHQSLFITIFVLDLFVVVILNLILKFFITFSLWFLFFYIFFLRTPQTRLVSTFG